jgi:nitroimidazol reductase NimA-like FMN-containing flavoprotein (pyridoxamine 5'-phosphate oxidase superfamily)
MKFHLRRVDRKIEDEKALRRLLAHQQYMTLSMADGGEPYAVPLGYVYDEAVDIIYFHCAKEGKKMQFLKKNPRVWCVVTLDEGVQEGACVNLYASAMFSGRVEWVTDAEEKRRVMNLFAEKLSRDSESVKQRLKGLFAGGEAALSGVVFAKVKVEELSGKRSTEMTVEKLLELTG